MRLTFCADDYGLLPGADAAMLALAQAGRIQALGAMSTSERWPEAAAALDELPAGVACGLHFNLSEGVPLSTALRRHWPRLPGLATLLARAAVGALPAQAIADEWLAQLDAFVAAHGCGPDFLDGHQHVHALPGVRDAALALARSLDLPLRNSGRLIGPGFGFKRRVIQACGGRELLQELRARGVRHASALVGVYDFSPEADYRRLMRGWLAAVAALPSEETALLFCHPGQGELDPGDAIAPARRREAAYLASAAFTEDLAEFGLGT